MAGNELQKELKFFDKEKIKLKTNTELYKLELKDRLLKNAKDIKKENSFEIKRTYRIFLLFRRIKDKVLFFLYKWGLYR